MTVKLDWKILRPTQSTEQKGEAISETEIILFADDPNRRRLVDMLNNTNTTTEPMYLHNIFPKFLKVVNSGSVMAVTSLMSTVGE